MNKTKLNKKDKENRVKFVEDVKDLSIDIKSDDGSDI